MFSFFNRHVRPVPVQGPPGPAGPMGPAGLDGRDGKDGSPAVLDVHVHSSYPAPKFHPVESAPADHPVPCRSHDGDAGHDLHAALGGVIPSGQRRTIPTGYSVDLDPTTYGKVEGRSGLARDYGLVVLGGVIDSGYTGEIAVILHNTGDVPFRYDVGDRVAQLVVQPVVVDSEDCRADGERGPAGFGSTGRSAVEDPEGGSQDLPLYPAGAAYFNEHHSTPGFLVRDREGDLWEYREPTGDDDETSYGWVMGNGATARQMNQAMGCGDRELSATWEPYTAVDPADGDTLELSETLPEDVGVDMVNHPPHYASHVIFPGECWEYAQWMTYGQGAAFKYLWRAEDKDTVIQNLDKAHWYLTNGGLAHQGLAWVNLEMDQPGLAAALSDATMEAEDSIDDLTLGQLFLATAATFTALGEEQDALEYVQRALDWYQQADRV